MKGSAGDTCATYLAGSPRLVEQLSDRVAPFEERDQPPP